jgi:YD repeat-containing protein
MHPPDPRDHVEGRRTCLFATLNTQDQLKTSKKKAVVMALRSRTKTVGVLVTVAALRAMPMALLHAGDTNYTYDALGRLTTVTRADGAQTAYTLDAAGNRTQVQESTARC